MQIKFALLHLLELYLTPLNIACTHCKIIANKFALSHSLALHLTFVECRLRLGIKNKQNLFCSSLGLHYICMPQPTNGCGDILVKERFAFIHRRNLDNFSLSWIMSKVLTLVLYMHPINGVCYIPSGVGYCLLQLAGSPEPRRGNYNSSHAFFFY